jgi:hypothetical protein
VLGLGLGFVSIWAIGMLVQLAQHHWWPLIPGGILTTVGTALLIGGGAVELLDYWGIALVAIGLIVVWRAYVQVARLPDVALGAASSARPTPSPLQFAKSLPS